MTSKDTKNRNYCFTLHVEEELANGIIDRNGSFIEEDESDVEPSDGSTGVESFPGFRGLFARNDGIKGICGQLERGEGGKLHFQGYLELTGPMRIAAIKKFGGAYARMHLEGRKGTRDQAVGYCTEATYNSEDKGRVEGPWYWPEKSYFTRSQQGKRTDLNQVAELIRGGATEREVAVAHTEAYVKFSTGIKRAIETIGAGRVVEEDFGYVFHDWQQALLDVIAGPIHKRRIYWVVDRKGGSGKTTFALWLGRVKGAFYTIGGKHDRIYHTYQGEPIACFDFTRSTEDSVPYGPIEGIKNGVAPRMYGFRTLFCNTPHVFCFSNFEPDQSKLSEDRWNIVRINEE